MRLKNSSQTPDSVEILLKLVVSSFSKALSISKRKGGNRVFLKTFWSSMCLIWGQYSHRSYETEKYMNSQVFMRIIYLLNRVRYYNGYLFIYRVRKHKIIFFSFWFYQNLRELINSLFQTRVSPTKWEPREAWIWLSFMICRQFGSEDAHCFHEITWILIKGIYEKYSYTLIRIRIGWM